MLKAKLKGKTEREARLLVLEWVQKDVITTSEANDLLEYIESVLMSGHAL